MAESLPVSGGVAFTNFVTNPSFSPTVASVTSEATFYGSENLTFESRTKRWRSTGTGAQDITFYFGGTSVLPTFFALVDSNLEDNKTVTLKGATDSGITTSVVTWNLTTHEQTDLGKFVRWYLGTPDSGTAAAKPYWRVTFPSYSPAEGYHTAGVVWLGTYIGVRPANVSIANVNETLKAQAYGGTVYSDQRRIYRTVTFTDENLTFDENYTLCNALAEQGDRPVLVDIHGTATTDAIEKNSAYYSTVTTASTAMVSSVQSTVSMSFSELRGA